MSLRPTTPRKRKYDEQAREREAQEAKEGALSATELPTDSEDDDLSPEELAEWAKHDLILMQEEAKWHAREAAWQARLEAEGREAQARERRQHANRMVYQAGSVERWYASMTPDQQQEWADLKDDLLRCERLRPYGAEWLVR